MKRPQYRAPRDPDCTHPDLTRTVWPGAGFIYPDAAVFDCPDCGLRQYGDADSGYDAIWRERHSI